MEERRVVSHYNLGLFYGGVHPLRRQLEEADRVFQNEVERFVERHWRPVASGPGGSVARRDWFDAVVAAGWSVPDWPAEYGGTGWSPTRRYLWQRACARFGAPDTRAFGVESVGPLIMRLGGRRLCARLLPGMRECRHRWCLAPFESGPGGLDIGAGATAMSPRGDVWLVDGDKAPVADAVGADWMACPGRRDSGEPLIAFIDLRLAGVDVLPMRTLAGDEDVAAVRLRDVVVDAELVVPLDDDGVARVQGLMVDALSSTREIAEAGVRLETLRTCVAGDEALRSDPDLWRAVTEARVLCAACEAMELRLLDALERGTPLPFSPAALHLRSAELALKIGELHVQTIGYYALPHPDEVLLHNEGPIGPPAALPSMREVLRSRVRGQLDQRVAALRGQLSTTSLDDEGVGMGRTSEDESEA